MVGPGPPKQRAAAAAPGPCVVLDDALVEMFGLLPANSLHRFKCVSKAWCGLVTDPLHCQRYAQTLAGFPELFGGRFACQFRVEYSVVAVHPDGNWVFFVRHWDRKLVAYDMDRREVRAVADLGPSGGDLGDELPVPYYVPLYKESAALTNSKQ
ncbi:unnamed protein product [Miscanthus lutarioriparius]|uniref:F-box domain-containing protein n=1 Tax=Miscanthus lutarioriparius TaxID=422564 RepID=A0A811NBD3_9POAL|nr:unnamed protein product [Miscanthus lutarioriparius]